MNTDKYLTTVQKLVARSDDPVQQARMVNDEIAAVSDVLRQLGQLRSDAIRTARERMSVQAIADALGVTRARVYQIAQEN